MNKAKRIAEENDNDKFEEMLEQERRDEAMREEKEECLSERQKGHRDSGMNESDFY